MNRIAYIYKITSPKGKVYIGSTFNVKKRWTYYKNGCCNRQVKLYNSLLKYGHKSHTFEVIVECTQEDRNEQECYYGNLFCVLGVNGLNLALPKKDERFSGVSDETKFKIGKAHKGKIVSKETCKRISNTQKGKIPTQEVLDRLRYLSSNQSDEAKLKRSIAHRGNQYRKGIPHDNDSLKKISDNSRIFLYVIIDNNGIEFTTDCLVNFCKEKSLTPQNLANTFRGFNSRGQKHTIHKGYKIVSKISKIK